MCTTSISRVFLNKGFTTEAQKEIGQGRKLKAESQEDFKPLAFCF